MGPDLNVIISTIDNLERRARYLIRRMRPTSHEAGRVAGTRRRLTAGRLDG
jgi:hypothetical protein